MEFFARSASAKSSSNHSEFKNTKRHDRHYTLVAFTFPLGYLEPSQCRSTKLRKQLLQMKPKQVYTGLQEEAGHNLADISASTYHGRWFIQGVNASGTHYFQLYGIEVRSAPNRNRVLTKTAPGMVETEVADSSQESGDPALTLYPAMADVVNRHIVSNGKQTVNIMHDFEAGAGLGINMGLGRILEDAKYEEDSNSTPRITGVISSGVIKPRFEFSIIQKSAHDPSVERFYYQYDSIQPGYGRFISTYANNSPTPQDKIPTFHGEPRLVYFPQNDEDIEPFFRRRCTAFLISTAMKRINIETGLSEKPLIWNRTTKVTPASTPDSAEPPITNEYA